MNAFAHRRPVRPWPGVGAWLLLLMAWLFLGGCATGRLDTVYIQNRPATPAEYADVAVLRGGQPLPAKGNTALKPGDEIRTGAQSTAILWFEGTVEVVLDPGTRLQVVNPSIRVLVGKILTKIAAYVGAGPEKVDLKRWDPFAKPPSYLKSSFEVETEYVTAGAEGTVFSLATDATGATTVAALEGVVTLRSPQRAWEPVALQRFNKAVVRGPGPPEVSPLSRHEFNQLVVHANATERLAGKPSPSLLVPSLLGVQEAEAEALLRREGLRVGRKTPSEPGGQPAGVVASQNPEPGDRVSPGAPVSLGIANPPPGAAPGGGR